MTGWLWLQWPLMPKSQWLKTSLYISHPCQVCIEGECSSPRDTNWWRLCFLKHHWGRGKGRWCISTKADPKVGLSFRCAGHHEPGRRTGNPGELGMRHTDAHRGPTADQFCPLSPPSWKINSRSRDIRGVKVFLFPPILPVAMGSHLTIAQSLTCG
jgi:hypothetical protein